MADASQPEEPPDRGATRDFGERNRRSILGDEWVDNANASAVAFGEDFQDYVTRTAWGDVWARPGLERRVRSMLTLAMLTALHSYDEIGLHVRVALRNGLTVAEIEEVFLQAAVYAGVPAARGSFITARRVLEELGQVPVTGSPTD